MALYPRNMEETIAQGDVITTKNRPPATWTASSLEEKLGDIEIEMANAELHRILDPLFRQYNLHEAVCRLSEMTSGRGDSLLVVLGDDGPTAVPLTAVGHYVPAMYFWLGFCEVEDAGNPPHCGITKLYQMSTWTKHKPMIQEIMATAYVWGEHL